MIFSLTPGLIYIIAGVFAFLLKGRFSKLFILTIPVIAFFQLLSLNSDSSFTTTFLMKQLEFLRVDNLSMVFAYVFVISSFAAFLYGISFAKKIEYSSALIYIGSALSVIFAQDLITIYIFWELMAISSTMLILLNGTNKSLKASIRYIIVHIVGGLVLLAGIMLHINETGSTDFIHFKVQNLAT